MDHPSPLRPNTEKIFAFFQRQSEVTRNEQTEFHNISSKACLRWKKWDSEPSKSVIYSRLDCHWFFYRAWLNKNHAKRVRQRGFQATYSHTGNNCFLAVSKHVNTKIYTKLSFPKTSSLLSSVKKWTWIDLVINIVCCSHFQCKVPTGMWIQFSKLDTNLLSVINYTFTL